ncbi:MAG: DUF1801 domain-containing protein [Chitinophagaceae bacterium]
MFTQYTFMLRPIDQFYLLQNEPEKSVFEFLRTCILSQNQSITESLKYGMPFFSINGKMFCYVWFHKKLKQPYLGIVEGGKIHHPDLIQEKRSRMKILLINPDKDIPLKKIEFILNETLRHYL